mgnify:CR=1 FL=1
MYIIKMYIYWRCFILNITDLNNKIYGHKDLKEGEYANFMMDTIEQQKEINFNMDNINGKYNEINKEIKF